jgi:hypothetical protein
MVSSILLARLPKSPFGILMAELIIDLSLLI